LNGRAFSNLKKLTDVALYGNECIDENFYSETDIAKMAKVIDSKCAFTEAPPVTTLTRTSTTRTTTSKPKVSTSRPTPANNFNPSCGQVNDITPRIFDGTETSRGQWPFLVALYHLENEKFFCGASLISTQHVLTGDLKSFSFAQLLTRSILFHSRALH
jgi:hypothetical protein